MASKRTRIRRRLTVEYREGDHVGFRFRSFTSRSRVYGPVIDRTTGQGFCDCQGRQFRPNRYCSHMKRCALYLVRRGEMQPELLAHQGENCCHRCGSVQDLYAMADDDGRPMHDVWVCKGCVAAPAKN